MKNDRADARTLATLLATGFVPGVWTPDERTRLLRRLVGRRAQLMKQRTSAKNAIHATLQRNLVGRDNINTKGTGNYTYKVCEAGGTTCSNEATVSF